MEHSYCCLILSVALVLALILALVGWLRSVGKPYYKAGTLVKYTFNGYGSDRRGIYRIIKDVQERPEWGEAIDADKYDPKTGQFVGGWFCFFWENVSVVFRAK